MKTINIYSKTRNGKARLVQTIEIEDSFDAAVAACDAYRASLGSTAAKIFWNWAESAWNRRR
jgi:hypothetical protein